MKSEIFLLDSLDLPGEERMHTLQNSLKNTADTAVLGNCRTSGTMPAILILRPIMNGRSPTLPFG